MCSAVNYGPSDLSYMRELRTTDYFSGLYTSCVCRQPNTAVVDSRRLHGSAGASTKVALCYLRQAQLELQIYFRLFGGFGVTDDAQVLGWI